MNDEVAPGMIRNLVVGVLIKDGHVLVEEYPGSPTQHAFHRLALYPNGLPNIVGNLT